MRATLAYGRRGLGRTAPNPSVGALVVKDGVVLGRGVTAPGGRPHAEPLALAQAGGATRGATLYVTLEPCSHHGRTGPCTDAIIAAGIARVVVATGDPDVRVAGRGHAQLRDAGIVVETGLCAAEAERDHVGHFRRAMAGRPTVTLKLAETADGYAAGPAGRARLMITGEIANAWVHANRASHDAVMVGAGTARADDPALTVRGPGLDARPARVVLDPGATVSHDSRLLADTGHGPVVIAVDQKADRGRLAGLRERDVQVIEVPGGHEGLDLASVLRALGGQGFTRVFCEGGPRLGAALLRADLVDRVAILTGPDALGEPGLPALDAAARDLLASHFRMIEDRSLGPDRLRLYERASPCSPA